MAQVPPSIRGVKKVAVCAIAAGALLLAIPVSAQAAEKAVMPDLTWGISSSEITQTQAAITDIGAKWVRLEFRWNEGEPRKGRYNDATLAEWDQAVATAQAAGAKIIAMVHRSPGWASGTNDTYMPPANPADYAAFVRFLASRYRGEVEGWEIWNEQNISRFWPSGPNAAEYVELLKAAYPAVKAGDPDAKVVFGGLAQSDYYYVTQAYKAGAKGYFDVMATHPYPDRFAPTSVWYNGTMPAVKTFVAYREVRRRMLANGDDKPIWFTEMGWSTCTTDPKCVTPERQALYLTSAYCILEQDPYVEVATWYNLRNNHWDNDADHWETQLGLMQTTFAPKPAYAAFKNYGSAPCPEINLPPDSLAPPAEPEPTEQEEPTEPTDEPASEEEPEAVTSSSTRRRSATLLRKTRLASADDVRKFLVYGRVKRADAGRVTVRVRRGGDATVSRVKVRSVRVHADGTFRRVIRFSRESHWRVRARYEGNRKALPSRSRILKFRT